MIDLDELEKLAKSATPGPWEWEPPSKEPWPVGDESLVTTWNAEDGEPNTVVTSWGYDADGVTASAEDRAFIAAAYPQVVLELIERVRQQETLIVRQQRYIEELERVDGVGLTAERDAALAALERVRAEADAYAEQSDVMEPCGAVAQALRTALDGAPEPEWGVTTNHCAICTFVPWPCPTAVALGLNEGENDGVS